MGFVLQDGATGTTAEVDSAQRLSTFSITEPEDKHVNKEGRVWSVYFTVTPAGANDYFFYLKNTGTNDLFISDIRISSSVASTIFYEVVSGTPSYITGTDITPTNRNLGSSQVPTATVKYDTDITGLTSGGVIFFEECTTANQRYKISTSSNIIIPQGKAIAFKREAATGAIECVVSLIGQT